MTLNDESSDEKLTGVRIDVAEMKGMLSAYLPANEIRLSSVERLIAIHETRLDEKAKTIASEKERNDNQDRAIKELQDDNKEFKDDNRAKFAQIIGIISLLIAAGGLCLAILNRITFI